MQYKEMLLEWIIYNNYWLPTYVQAVCHTLGDVLGISGTQILLVCIGDEPVTTQFLIKNGLLFRKQVLSLVDTLAENV